MPSATQMFDRRQWINGIRTRVKTEKFINISLRPNGVTADELRKALGPAFGVHVQGNRVMVALNQRVATTA